MKESKNYKCLLCPNVISGITNKKYCSDCNKLKQSETNIRTRQNLKQRLESVDEKDKDFIITYYLKGIKKSAENRKIIFDLSLTQVEEFYKADCFYCGDPIKNLAFDRYDSNLGYTISNIVPCCNLCNTMKWDYPADVFIKQCQKIANNKKP